MAHDRVDYVKLLYRIIFRQLLLLKLSSFGMEGRSLLYPYLSTYLSKVVLQIPTGRLKYAVVRDVTVLTPSVEPVPIPLPWPGTTRGRCRLCRGWTRVDFGQVHVVWTFPSFGQVLSPVHVLFIIFSFFPRLYFAPAILLLVEINVSLVSWTVTCFQLHDCPSTEGLCSFS